MRKSKQSDRHFNIRITDTSGLTLHTVRSGPTAESLIQDFLEKLSETQPIDISQTVVSSTTHAKWKCVEREQIDVGPFLQRARPAEGDARRISHDYLMKTHIFRVGGKPCLTAPQLPLV